MVKDPFSRDLAQISAQKWLMRFYMGGNDRTKPIKKYSKTHLLMTSEVIKDIRKGNHHDELTGLPCDAISFIAGAMSMVRVLNVETSNS